MEALQVDLSRGFLPAIDPLENLPSEYAIWDEYGQNLPKILLADDYRQRFDAMPLLATEQLQTQAELERAMLLLSFFAHAYVWGGSKPEKKIPRAIAIPFSNVAEKLKRPPVLSYSSYALNNWKQLDSSKEIALGNIALIQNFLGGVDEEWFVLVHVDIERKAAAALQIFKDLMRSTEKGDIEKSQAHLEVIASSLSTMCDILDRMPQRCDPYIYYNRVRPYLNAWKDNPALPDGLIYEGVNNNQPLKYRGETGAQSSIIPSFDALFGITHQEDPLKVYLMEMREYMPEAHRNFIAYVENHSRVREFIIDNKKINKLREIYNDCLQLISRFRQTHLRYAAQYIQKQSQTSAANPTHIGTGGTPFMNYLRKHKDETLEHLIK